MLKTNVISYDTETDGLNPYLGDRMFAYSLCNAAEKTDVRRLDRLGKNPRAARAKLLDMWRDPSVSFTMHNRKFDEGHTEAFFQEEFPGHDNHCTYTMSRIIQSNHPTHKLKDIGWELFRIPRDDEHAIKRHVAATQTDYSTVPVHLMTKYQRLDAARGMLAFLFFMPKIMASPAHLRNYQMEMKLTRVTIAVERRGIMVNRKACAKLIVEYSQKAQDALQNLYDVSGRRINPDSHDQVAWLLFQKYKLPPKGYTDGGKPSTKKKYLQEMQREHDCPALNLIMQFRSYSRGVSMLTDYLEYVDADDIIHTDINNNGARPGRQSSSRPNLFNVAKEKVLQNPYPIPARRAFRPRPGYVNFHFDYVGQEARIMIDSSQDEKMIDMVRRGEDTHAAAAKVFYLSKFIKLLRRNPEAAKEFRNAAKNGFFSVCYGGGPDALAGTLMLTKKEGYAARERFRKEFPDISGLNKRDAMEAKEQGWVETRFGRRMHIPRQDSYMATNYKTQGTGAGMVKRAQVRVHPYLQEATGGEAGIILPIYDELVIEFPRKRLRDAPEVLNGIRDRMIDFPMFSVPMEVDVNYSTASWAELKPFELERRKR